MARADDTFQKNVVKPKLISITALHVNLKGEGRGCGMLAALCKCTDAHVGLSGSKAYNLNAEGVCPGLTGLEGNTAPVQP